MTLVYLVRHASHADLGRVLTGRLPGVGLTMGGKVEANRLAAWFRGRTVASVWCSPRERAVETAAAIAESNGHQARPDPAFDEIDYAGWSGRRFDALSEDPVWREWNERRGSARVPGGESMGEVVARVSARLLDLARERPDGGIVVVTHADPIRAAVADVLGFPLDNVHRLEIAPASVTTMRLGRSEPVLLGLSERIVDTTEGVAAAFHSFDPGRVPSS